MRLRAHVAGRGAVTGFGVGNAALVEGIFAGRSVLRARRRTAGYRASTAVAGEFPPGALDEDAPETELAFLAALRAAEEALDEGRVAQRARVGLVLATTKADLSGVVSRGDGLGLPIRLAQRLAARLGIERVLAAVSTACASGLCALALAQRRIALGEEERVLVVGVDALCEFILAGFGSLQILDPGPCRPFDVDRRGLSLGEAAAAILLSAHERESLGFHIAGQGGANDACPATGCDRAGRGLALAVRRALEDARIDARDVDVVHLHGTGTAANDASEAIGLGLAFEGPTPPAFGTKGQTGHTLGASGVLESLVVLAALERGLAPANAGLERPDSDARLALVRAPQRLERSRRALKVARGFGGVQQVLLFEA